MRGAKWLSISSTCPTVPRRADEWELFCGGLLPGSPIEVLDQETYGLRKYSTFNNPSSHKVCQLALRSAFTQSLSVLASTLAVDHGAVSVLRTASGMPDNRSSPVFLVADAEQLSRSLAPDVLGGT